MVPKWVVAGWVAAGRLLGGVAAVHFGGGGCVDGGDGGVGWVGLAGA